MVVIFFATAAFMLGRAPAVWAHADLVRSEPPANSVLSQPPERVTIWFTEPLEPQFADIQVLDAGGQRVDNGDTAVDPQDRTRLSVSLPPLAEGIYTVAWRNVSTVDGHKVRGNFLFSIGQPLEASAITADTDRSLLQSPLEPVLRWLTLLTVMAAVGGLGFQIGIARPAVRQTVPSQIRAGLMEELDRRAMKLILLALLLFALASAGHLLLQAVISNEATLFQVLGRPILALLGQTGWGRLWLARMGLLLVMLFLLRRSQRSEHDAGRYPLLALVTGLAILLSLSLTSHAAATTGIQAGAVFNDYLHLLAATFWVGGLIFFFAALPPIWAHLAGKRRQSLLTVMAAQFSLLGVASMILLGITGTYNAWAQVTLPAALATFYGRVLLAKVGLVVLILALAGLNLLWVRPRLSNQEEAGNRLRLLVAGEIGLALVVLLLTGLLTALEPARQVASRAGLGQNQADLVLTDDVNGGSMQIAIRPGQVGANQIIVTLGEDSPAAEDETTEVTLRLSFLGSDIGRETINTTYAGDGRFVADNVLLNLPGTWQILVWGYQLDAPDIFHTFRFPLSPLGKSSTAIFPAADTGQNWLIIELAILGLVLVGTGWQVWNRKGKKTGATVTLPGIVSLGFAFFLLMSPAPEVQSGSTRNVDTQSTVVVLAESMNPIVADRDSLATGQAIYEAHCLTCHGLTGHGDGPRGVGTDAVDIIEHIPLHAAAEYFQIITDHENRGDISYSTNPINESDIWHLVNYLEVLEDNQAMAEKYFSQARSLAEQGQIAPARSHLNQAVELSPRYIQAWQGRGILSSELGDLEQALADYNRVIELDPTYSAGYYERAQVYLATGRWLEALADLQDYLALEPQTSGRPAIEQQIARLQEISTEQASSPASNITVQLADLPSGFSTFPPRNLGLIPGSPLNNGTVIDSSFAFTAEDQFELVWGFVSFVETDEQKDAFDARLNMTDLTNFISTGLQAESVESLSALPIPETLGEASSGVTAIFISNGIQARVEGLAFRQGDIGAYLFLMYDDNEQATIAIDNLAQILADRMN
jgi:copper transport protein